jgi:Cu+-exporting ATPase
VPVLFYCASGFFVSAWKTIRFKSLNIDAPIALAIAVTFGRSLYEIISGTGSGYLDSMSGIVFFMLIGRYFQDRTYENISFDRDYRSYFPIAVSVLRGGREEVVPVTRLNPGDRIVIRNGELVPADSILRSEKASIDYSFVSGEAEPVEKKKGETIFAGARQTLGAIELEVQKATSQSYLTQLWNNDAGSQRRESEHKTYIDAINRWFSSALLLVAFGAAIAWLFIDPSKSLNAMTAVMIVVCPCTLLLAATFTEGSVLRWLGRNRFYLKNASIIERLATADAIVFDKTGTITRSESAIEYEGEPLSADEQEAVAALAWQSGHPLSRRIANALSKTAPALKVTGVQEIAGKGIMATIDGKQYLLGSRSFAGAELSAGEASGAWLAVNGKVKGRYKVHSAYRQSLPKVIETLKKEYSIDLLSGDNDSEKETLRPLFGEKMRFGQLPHEKLDYIKQLQQQGKKVVMVGDGLNDAGALMQADAGIAISDNMNNYFPACDAILDGEEFSRLPALLSFAKAAKRVVSVAFVLSVLYNCVGIYFSVRGEMSPLVAAVLMPISSISVILLTTTAVRIAAMRRKLTVVN